jgi:hypothetical protein
VPFSEESLKETPQSPPSGNPGVRLPFSDPSSASGQNLPLTMDSRSPTSVADGWTAGYAHVVQLRLKLWQERRNVTVQDPSIAIVIWFYCCFLSRELCCCFLSFHRVLWGKSDHTEIGDSGGMGSETIGAARDRPPLWRGF